MINKHADIKLVAQMAVPVALWRRLRRNVRIAVPRREGLAYPAQTGDVRAYPKTKLQPAGFAVRQRSMMRIIVMRTKGAAMWHWR